MVDKNNRDDRDRDDDRRFSSDHLSKSDMDTILKVNTRAVEIQTEISSQNEDLMNNLSTVKTIQMSGHDKLDKIIEQNETLSRDLFTIKILFLSGLISIVLQIISIFLKK